DLVELGGNRVGPSTDGASSLFRVLFQLPIPVRPAHMLVFLRTRVARMVLEFKAQLVDFALERVSALEVEALGILARRTRLVDRIAQRRGKVTAFLGSTPGEALGDLDTRNDLHRTVEVIGGDPPQLGFLGEHGVARVVHRLIQLHNYGPPKAAASWQIHDITAD